MACWRWRRPKSDVARSFRQKPRMTRTIRDVILLMVTVCGFAIPSRNNTSDMKSSGSGI